MTGFELVFITDPALNDKDLESLQKNIKMSLSKSKGKLFHEYVWGRRRLAYEIEGNDFGVYHTWYFTGSGKTVDELQRQFGYSDNVLRHQIVKVEDLDTEAVFMQNLIPPKEERIDKESSEESLKQGQVTEKNVSANSDNEELVEEEKIETERQSESDKKESGNSAQEDDSDSSEV
jgi:small subunit ribosomal protein S6